jgi:large conductance mechanosensitive channel
VIRLLKGFKDFIMRGNVLDLAVAVVMGTAFTAVVTAVVTNLINPLIAVFGGNNINGLSVQINGSNPATIMHFDSVITAMINFLVIGAVVYFAIVLPVKKIRERRKRGQEPGPAEPTNIELLTEIRDLLREQRSRMGS